MALMVSEEDMEDSVEEEPEAWVEDTVVEDMVSLSEDLVVAVDQCRTPVDAVECRALVEGMGGIWIVLDVVEGVGCGGGGRGRGGRGQGQ